MCWESFGEVIEVIWVEITVKIQLRHFENGFHFFNFFFFRWSPLLCFSLSLGFSMAMLFCVWKSFSFSPSVWQFFFFIYIILKMWNFAAYIVNTCAIRTGYTQALSINFMHWRVHRPQHLTLLLRLFLSVRYSLQFGVHCLFFTVALFRHLCAMLAIQYGQRFIFFLFSLALVVGNAFVSVVYLSFSSTEQFQWKEKKTRRF